MKCIRKAACRSRRLHESLSCEIRDGHAKHREGSSCRHGPAFKPFANFCQWVGDWANPAFRSIRIDGGRVMQTCRTQARGCLGRLVRATPLLMLSACASVDQGEPRVVIGRISRLVSDGAVESRVGAQWSRFVYEVRPQGSPDAPIFLVVLSSCPFDHDRPERIDPNQLFRIEYVSSADFHQNDPPHSELVTTKCEKV
jgi:hypothetical protein